MRLHVGVIRSKDRFGALDRQAFGDVDELAPAVIPFAGIPLGVLVGQHAGHRFANGAARVILGRDQLKVVALPPLLARNGKSDFGILGSEVYRFEELHGDPFDGRRSEP